MNRLPGREIITKVSTEHTKIIAFHLKIVKGEHLAGYLAPYLMSQIADKI